MPLVLLAITLGMYGIGTTAQPAAAAVSNFTFAGGGWGHGVGMSQWGARAFAANGSSYAQILQHYYTGVAVAPGGISDDLSILVANNAGSMTLTAAGTTALSGVGTLAPGQAVTVARSGADLVFSGALAATVAGPVDISLATAGGPLTVSPPGYSYRYGTLRISADAGGGVRGVVRSLTMQQYLYGLGEMPSSWPAEALKAQATAARTYAQKKRNARGAKDFDMYGSVSDQSYTGTKWEVAAWNDAVIATDTQLITHNGGLIDAVYSASSGGHTENSEYVWVSPVPYLRGVADPFDAAGGNPNGAWSRTFSGTELGGWFGLGTMTGIQVLGPLGVSGRVDRSTIRLTGTGGTKDVTGVSFRSTVNSEVASSRQLMSTKFTVNGSTAPPTPGNTMPTGSITVATAEGSQIIIGGTSVDPDGYPLVRVVSTMGTQRAVRDYTSTNGAFLLWWNGGPGTRNVCVTVYDVPTGQGVSLGCRNIVVK